MTGHAFHRRRSRAGGSAVALCCLLTAFLLCGFAKIAPAQSGSADEFEIRAAMLFNLTRFIDWPPGKMDAAHSQFVFCILGADPIGVDLDLLLRNKTIETKPVSLRHITSIEAAGECHVLYIGAGEHKNLVRISAALEKEGVLIVSERSNLDSPDQMIGLPTVDDHVRIDVNLALTQRGGFAISSKLLHLATVTR